VHRAIHGKRVNAQGVRLLCEEPDTIEFEIDTPSSPYIAPLPATVAA
jgi:hypothetical protein